MRRRRTAAAAAAAEIAEAHSSGELVIPDVPDVALQQTDISWDTDAAGKRVILGTGRYGTVCSGTLYGSEPVAIKCIPLDGGGSAKTKWVDRIMREVALLKACRSNYVVNYLGYSFSAAEMQLVTELLRGGDLAEAIKAGSVSWAAHGSGIALDIASGLHYLHSRSPKVVHLDLKSSNVLLTEEFRAKITDVGLAQVLPMSKNYLSSVGDTAQGTFPYAAPEQLMGTRCSTAADMYSFGVVLWEMCTGEPPVRGRMRDVRVPQEAPQAIADLMQACWDAEPDKRPTAAHAIEVIKFLAPDNV